MRPDFGLVQPDEVGRCEGLVVRDGEAYHALVLQVLAALPGQLRTVAHVDDEDDVAKSKGQPRKGYLHPD